MQLAPTNLLDGTVYHMPNGRRDGEYSWQANGTIPFFSPDSSDLGNITVAHLDSTKTYALLTTLDLAEDCEVTAFMPGGPHTYGASGLVIQTFSGVTSYGLSWRASGGANSVFGPAELREVLAA